MINNLFSFSTKLALTLGISLALQSALGQQHQVRELVLWDYTGFLSLIAGESSRQSSTIHILLYAIFTYTDIVFYKLKELQGGYNSFNVQWQLTP